MFESNQDIHFACHQCGQCCTKSPEMSFYDMLELSEKFIFQTAHHTMISYAKNPLEKELVSHYQLIGHTIMMPELEASLFYFVNFIPVSLPSYGSCPQLKDNKCSIYGDRPATCKISPFSAFYDEQQQWKTINFFKKQVDAGKWNCSFDKKDPLIYSRNDLYIPGQSAIYHQEIINIREITDKYIEFLSLQGEGRKNTHFKALFDAMRKNALMISDVVFVIQMARYYNIISEDVAIRFFSNQLKCLQKELDYTVKIKNKDNLQTSRLYKRMIDDYEKLLKSDLFKDNYENEFGLIN